MAEKGSHRAANNHFVLGGDNIPVTQSQCSNLLYSTTGYLLNHGWHHITRLKSVFTFASQRASFEPTKALEEIHFKLENSDKGPGCTRRKKHRDKATCTIIAIATGSSNVDQRLLESIFNFFYLLTVTVNLPDHIRLPRLFWKIWYEEACPWSATVR